MKNEKSPYERYLDAAFELERTEQGEYTPDALREVQAAMLDALRSKDPLPEEMRLHLCFAFEYLCEGIASDLLTPVKRPGGRESPIFKKTREDAIRYLHWCRDGRIKDPSPVSSVGSAYEVNTRTVQNWLKSWGEKPTPSLRQLEADRFRGKMKINGKETPSLMPPEDYIDSIKTAEAARVVRLMRINGERYKYFKSKGKRKT